MSSNVDELLEEIKNLDIVKKNQKIAEKLNSKQELKDKMEQFKLYQQSLVKKNKKNIAEDNLYHNLKEELLNEYLMIEHFNNVDEINELIALISKSISFNL